MIDICFGDFQTHAEMATVFFYVLIYVISQSYRESVKRNGLMASALDSGSRGLGSSAGWVLPNLMFV